MDIDFSSLFSIDTPLLEIFVRGSLMYLGILVLLRVVLRREVGSIGVPDLLMVTLIADAAQNGMAGEYHSISVGLWLVAILIFWNFILDWLSYRFKWCERMLRSRPLCIVQRGRILPQNLRLVSMSNGELMSLLREEGIEEISEVKAAYLEGDGKLSVIREKKN